MVSHNRALAVAARGAELRNKSKTKPEIDGERAGINRRANALLAHHVQQALDRPYGCARQQPDHEDEHQMIAGVEMRAEQAQNPLP
jgi:hypothetical protein